MRLTFRVRLILIVPFRRTGMRLRIPDTFFKTHFHIIQYAALLKNKCEAHLKGETHSHCTFPEDGDAFTHPCCFFKSHFHIIQYAALLKNKCEAHLEGEPHVIIYNNRRKQPIALAMGILEVVFRRPPPRRGGQACPGSFF